MGAGQGDDALLLVTRDPAGSPAPKRGRSDSNNMRAISGGLMSVAEASRIAARCLVEACLARFESRFSRCPSAGASSRTNTSGGRMGTSLGRMRPASTSSGSFRSNVMRGRTSHR
jgi:hypothetical protein